MNIRLLMALVFSVFIGMTSSAHAVLIGTNNGDLYNLNVATNTSTLIGNSGMGVMFDIALDPTTSILYGITSSGLVTTINTSTGIATGIGTAGAFVNGLTFDSTGTLFGSGGRSLFTIDLDTGSATTVGNTGYNSSGDIAFDSLGNLYLSATSVGNDRLIAVNSLTGAGSLIGDTGFSGVYGLNFDGSTLNGFTSNGRTLEIDIRTGIGTQVATNSIRAFGADGSGGVEVSSIPEPTSIALFSLGIIGLGFARRKTS